MDRRPFAPDPFALGMLAFGLLLLLLPLMRVAALVAISAAVAYWLVIAVLRSTRKRH